jgi:hypothetical protein
MLAIAYALWIPNISIRSTRATKNECIYHLKQIDGAIQQWALENKLAETNVPILFEAVKYLKNGVLPTCPDGGSYAAGKTIADPPTCTKANTLGHSLP